MNVKQVWSNTANYKTRSAAVLLAIFQFIQVVAPNLLEGKTEEIVRSSIDLFIIIGGADWVWRNRYKVIEFLTKKFKKHDNT